MDFFVHRYLGAYYSKNMMQHCHSVDYGFDEFSGYFVKAGGIEISIQIGKIQNLSNYISMKVRKWINEKQIYIKKLQ